MQACISLHQNLCFNRVQKIARPVGGRAEGLRGRCRGVKIVPLNNDLALPNKWKMATATVAGCEIVVSPTI